MCGGCCVTSGHSTLHCTYPHLPPPSPLPNIGRGEGGRGLGRGQERTMTLALQASGITKRFPGVLANDHVNFELEKGEIHALLGENGAGKSTLMNILYGLYQPDEGNIFINEQPTQIISPHDAIAQGIGMVHQHFMLVPPLTV